MTMADEAQPIMNTTETPIITTVEAPSALEGVVSLHDQQYTMKMVAAPDTSMLIHNANPVVPVKGATLKICRITK